MGEPVGAAAAEAADDAGSVGWLGTWTLTIIVLALIAIAVGDELAIAHPGTRRRWASRSSPFGGPALFLVAQVFFPREALGRVPLSRSLALAALAILAVATSSLTLMAGIAAACARARRGGRRRHHRNRRPAAGALDVTPRPKASRRRRRNDRCAARGWVALGLVPLGTIWPVG